MAEVQVLAVSVLEVMVAAQAAVTVEVPPVAQAVQAVLQVLYWQ
ncbi:MAG: hypothetical protein WB612_05010 [Nitrososphaeraceae archaeon]